MSSTPLHPNKNGVHKLKTHQGAAFLFMVQLGVSTFCSFCNKHKATAWTPATNTFLKPPNWLLNHAVTISPVLEGRCNRRWWNRMIERTGKDMSSTWQGTWMQQSQRTNHCPCEKVQKSGKSRSAGQCAQRAICFQIWSIWDSTLNATDLEHSKVKNY
jgi:hypothetical protein